MISVECVNSDNIYETTLLFLKNHGAGQCYGESFFFFFDNSSRVYWGEDFKV